MPPLQDDRSDMDLLVWSFLGGLLAATGGYYVARFTGSGRKTQELQLQLEAKVLRRSVETAAESGQEGWTVELA